jgi:Fic family protein
MRTYQATHPWLKFSVDLAPAAPELWMMLGECQSKCQHLARVPLKPEVSDQLNRLYIAKGVLATTAIEGNTMTQEEVEKYLGGELKLPPSREYLGQEIDNIADECNRIAELVSQGAQPILNRNRIEDLNRQVLRNLVLAEGVVAGEVRRHEVGVALYKGAPPEDCVELLDNLCSWLNDTTLFGEPTHPRALIYAILKAIMAHLYLAWIHAFGDGNGRTARLVEFQILIASGIPAPAAHLLSNHYNLTRTDYYRQLHLASTSGGDVLPFINYAVQGFLDGLYQQLDLVRQQVFDIMWQDYIVDLFAETASTPTDTRRLELLQEISRQPGLVSISQLPMRSPRVAKNYANLTPKTLVRDVRKLIKMRLVVIEGGKIRARKERIQAFLPPQAILPLRNAAQAEQERSVA